MQPEISDLLVEAHRFLVFMLRSLILGAAVYFGMSFYRIHFHNGGNPYRDTRKRSLFLDVLMLGLMLKLGLQS